MKSKIAITVIAFLLLSTCSTLFAWGREAHKLINIKAVELLPDEMAIVKSWSEYIGDHASDPDIRRDTKVDTTEWPKHFIDVDFYPEFMNGNMITDKSQLVNLYGEEKVKKMGILPWATFETYTNLVQAFMEKSKDRILQYASDLGHYVGDGHQPFHTMLNYDGQLTDQKGIHGRYESEMVNRYINQVVNSVKIEPVEYVSNPLDYIFSYLTVSNTISPVIFSADKLAYEKTASHGSDDYYRLMWFRTEYITVDLISNASGALASLIFSAWIDAGKPDLIEIN